jgi:hypothetical protein
MAEAERARSDRARKLAELDRLLNDPDVPMQPARIWSLLAELAESERWSAMGRLPDYHVLN